MGAAIVVAAITAALVVLVERRRQRRAPPRRPRRRHTAEVLYTRAGDPRWGAVGAWDRGHHQRLSRRRMKASETRGAR